MRDGPRPMTDPILASCLIKKDESNLHCTRDITPKRVTSYGVHLRGLVSTSARNRCHVSSELCCPGAVSDLIGPGIEPTPPASLVVFSTTASAGWRVHVNDVNFLIVVKT